MREKGLTLFGAAAVCALLVVPIAIAGSSPGAESSADPTKQLKKKLAALTARVGALEGKPPSSGGAAGGDLTGAFPNPAIAPDAVTTGKLAAGAVNAPDLAGDLRPGHFRFFASEPSGGLDQVTSLGSVPGIEVKAKCDDQAPDTVLNLLVQPDEGTSVWGSATRWSDGTTTAEYIRTTGLAGVDLQVLQADANLLGTITERVFATIMVTTSDDVQLGVRTALISVNLEVEAPLQSCAVTGLIVPSGPPT